VLWNFFFGGNTLVRFGVIVLFFGVAFLLKYASEQIEISIEARLNSWSFDPPWGSLGPRHRRLVWLAIREQSL